MLKTTAVHDARLDHALEELLDNAEHLAAAGLAAQAHQALSLLAQSGPWRIPAHGAVVQRYQRVLPAVCFLADQPCPAIGGEPPMPDRKLRAEWAERSAGEALRVASAASVQLSPACGADWSPTFLATLADRHDASQPRPHLAFGRFRAEAECILAARLEEAFGCGSAMDLPSAVDLLALGVPPEEVALLMEQVQAGSTMPAAAVATGTVDIARATIDYLDKTGAAFTAHAVMLSCWLLLLETGRDAEALQVAGDWLPRDGMAASHMLHFVGVPSVGRFLRSGRLAEALQMTAEAADQWLAMLATRAAPASVATPARLPVEAAQSLEALLRRLDGTPLAPLSWCSVLVPGSGEQVWVAAIPVADRKSLWQSAREAMDRTGRWPLVTTLWGGQPPQGCDADVLANELFSRGPYESGDVRDDISPGTFIAAAEAVHVDDVLSRLTGHEGPADAERLVEDWQYELDAAGVVLDDFDQAWRACEGDRLRFEQWLAEQEARVGHADPELGRQPEFTPDNAWLVLLPTVRGEDALAYIHWFGIERGSAEGFVRLLRHWREAHGAELFAHYGTMLEFEVQRPPSDLPSALVLAREHELAAPCTLQLSGIPLRHYALGLVGHGAWFLHERP